MSDGYYYCVDCGEMFSGDDVENHWVENVHWWLDDRPTESMCFRACPYCHSEDIEECPTCEECGDRFHPDDLDENGLCEECRKALIKEEPPEGRIQRVG